MTVPAADLDLIRRDNVATRAQLRDVPNALALLRTSIHRDRDAEQEPGARWEIWRDRVADGGPCLLAGIRGRTGMLSWHESRGAPELVPAGTEIRGRDVEYWRGGQPEGATEGQEIPADIVYAAIGEFVATGARPTTVRWVSAAEIPDRLPETSIDHDPAYRAWLGISAE
uniref:Imm1 family immunity protein n=1 Tax=Amycolatopsis sp. CA-096443 TaxID=3239919 RepID=UPI003F490ED6